MSKANPELAPTAAVYDVRGNVRPRGTPGACRMTYAERVKIAEAVAAGQDLPPLPRKPDVPLPDPAEGDTTTEGDK